MRKFMQEITFNDKQMKISTLGENLANTADQASSIRGESRMSIKTVQRHPVDEKVIAQIDNLEKNIIKKKHDLQYLRKELYNNLEREQKQKLIKDLYAYGDSAVTELVKVFTVQDNKKEPKKLLQIKRLPSKDPKRLSTII